MKVEGHCHCGAIAYEAEVNPETVGICHCTDCQRLTGSAFRVNVQAAADTFVLRRGVPKIYVKTADSGSKRAHAFCPDCGGPVFARALANPTTYSLRIGALDKAAQSQLTPRRQIWMRSALPWVHGLGQVPQLDRQ